MDQRRFAEISRSIIQFDQAVEELILKTGKIGIPAPNGTEWYELLKQKLLTQLNDHTYLVVAVTGGTNTGKSIVFNHLAGENASASDPRAAGTKHPVCLIPENLSESGEIKNILNRYFESFVPYPWTGPNDPLDSYPEHRLFWRSGKNVPPRLFLLDTPDIDSQAEVNWDRANIVRQTADVLIAVLTSQKYNDATIKRFFREAKQASKPVILLFNMFDFETEREILPRWIEQFREETGNDPIATYVIPHDRENAAKLTLPFYPVDSNGKISETSVSLRKKLEELHFDEIKSKTLIGAIRRLSDSHNGVPSFFESIRRTALLFTDAKRTLSRAEQEELQWPGLPGSLLVQEVREWWNEKRPNWSQKMHGAYRVIGNGVLWPVRKVWNSFSGNKNPVDPIEEFRKSEFDTVTQIVQKTLERLEKMAETENTVLKSELTELLGGEHRKKLVEETRAAHDSMKPIGDDFRTYLRTTLDAWTEEHPGAVSTVKWLDHAAAIARPVITVTLFAGGFSFAGDVIGQTGTLVVGHVVGEAAIAGGITGGGEAVIHQGGEGIKRTLANTFKNIQEEYARDRAKQFFEWFQREIWSDLLQRLAKGEEIITIPEYLNAIEAFDSLRKCAN